MQAVVPEAFDRRQLAPYVSNLDRDVFALFGLPEEVIAVLFAYYSRSRDDLRSNLGKLLRDNELGVGAGEARPAFAFAAEKARAFHEKWVVGYGHASVAEHAVVHLALENVSILASKAVEDLRLGSYTEKSTRYVVFDDGGFAQPADLDAPLRELCRAANEATFAAYRALYPRVEQAVAARSPRREGQTKGGYDAALRAQACDLLRGLLPASTRTNLGLTANARALEGVLSKLLSNPIPEVRSLGEAMTREAFTVTPTLVKYARQNPFRAGLPGRIAPHLTAPSASGGRVPHASGGVSLLRHDHDALERVAIALAFEHAPGAPDAPSLAAHYDDTRRDDAAAIVRASLGDRGPFDAPPRAFEATTLTVELTLDYGAYRDLQRHRLLSPFVQTLGCDLGAELAPELDEMGLGGEARAALGQSERTWRAIAPHDPLSAQYAVPLAYRVRVLWNLNLRELIHVIELRSARQGHTAYRRVAHDLYRTAIAAMPWLEGLVRVDLADYALARTPS